MVLQCIFCDPFFPSIPTDNMKKIQVSLNAMMKKERTQSITSCFARLKDLRDNLIEFGTSIPSISVAIVVGLG